MSDPVGFHTRLRMMALDLQDELRATVAAGGRAGELAALLVRTIGEVRFLGTIPAPTGWLGVIERHEPREVDGEWLCASCGVAATRDGEYLDGGLPWPCDEIEVVIGALT